MNVLFFMNEKKNQVRVAQTPVGVHSRDLP